MNFFLSPKKQKDKDFESAINNIIGKKPDNVVLYRIAFKHVSAAKEIKKGFKDSNERLEFLGDAFLNCVVGEFLFRKFPYRDEGFLTEMRSKIVSRDSLNKLALKLGFDKLLQLSSDSNLSKNPSIYGNAFEAFMGALFLDKGFDKAKKIFLNRILKIHLDIDNIENTELNYKSRLLECVQKEHLTLDFVVAKEEVNKGRHLYTIHAVIDGKKEGMGKDFTKKKAEQMAAESAFKKLFSAPGDN